MGSLEDLLPTSFTGRLPKHKARKRRPSGTSVAIHPKKHNHTPHTASTIPFDFRYSVGPMVGCSDLAYRLLCRKYGATCVWSEMFHADKFASDPEYRSTMFQTLPEDRPLIVQFCGNTPGPLLAAAQLVQDQCDCIDINLGCPQRPARLALYGAYLTAREHWPKVVAMVKSLKSGLKIPVSCKIRLLDTVDDTIEFAQLLEANGCSLLTIHGRQLLSDHRKRRRHGPADLSAIATVRAAVSIPVITNGNVRGRKDVRRNLTDTGCPGIMVAEAVLANPALFDPEPISLQRLHKIAHEYLELAAIYPPPSFEYARAHIRAMLRRKGAGRQMRFELAGETEIEELRELLANATTLADLHSIVDATLGTVGQQTQPVEGELEKSLELAE